MLKAVIASRLMWFLVLALGSVSWAQSPNVGPMSGIPRKKRQETKLIRVRAGIDFATNYVWRGIYQQNHGLIAQPYAGVDVMLDTGELAQYLSNVRFTVDSWNDLASKPTGPNSPRNFYESDLTIGTGATIFQMVDFQMAWTAYMYPSSAGPNSTVQELCWRVTYNDQPLWMSILPGFQTTPYFKAALNIHPSQGVYYELGLLPGYVMDKELGIALTVEVPLIIGLGADHYYFDRDTGSEQIFGYFQTGLRMSVPFNLLAEEYGNLKLSGGLDVIVSDANMNSNRNTLELVGQFGVEWLY